MNSMAMGSSAAAYSGGGVPISHEVEGASKGSEVANSALIGVAHYDGIPSSHETSEGATSQRNSPSSPKYSAPPIRSAVLKSLFPQVCVKIPNKVTFIKTRVYFVVVISLFSLCFTSHWCLYLHIL